MEVIIKCRSSQIDTVMELLETNVLLGKSAPDRDRGEYVLSYPDEELYRDVDRFLWHCQAIGLIRDWSIER